MTRKKQMPFASVFLLKEVLILNKKHGMKQNFWLMIFVLPALIFYFLFKLEPAIVGFWYSLTSWNGIDPVKKFVGFQNYIEIFTKDGEFWDSIKITLKFVISLVILQNVIALGLAVFIESRRRAKGLFRTLFYMPNMISMIIGGYMWMFIFTKVLFFIADHSVLKFLDQSWVGDPRFSFIAIVIVSIWGGAGYLMVIYIAALQGVPQAMKEAASIDGASVLQSFRHITLPSIRHAITICIFITLSGSFQVFDVVYSLTGGGPGRATYVVAINIFQEAFKNNHRFGYASAKSMILFFIVMVITLIQLVVMRNKEVE